MPHLVQMRSKYAERGLLVLGVTKAAPEDALEFARETGVTYPLLCGAEDVFEDYGVLWVPAAKLIGPKGRVAVDDRRVGALSSRSGDIEATLETRLGD